MKEEPGCPGNPVCGNFHLDFNNSRNIPSVDILPVNDINTYEILDNKKIVIVEPCLKYIEEVLA